MKRGSIKFSICGNSFFTLIISFTLFIYINNFAQTQTMYFGKYNKTTVKSQNVTYPNSYPIYLVAPRDTVLTTGSHMVIPFTVNYLDAAFTGTFEIDYSAVTPPGIWDNSNQQTNFSQPLLFPVRLTGTLTLPPTDASTLYRYNISINSPYPLYETICPSTVATASNDKADPGSYSISLSALCPISILGPINYLNKTNVSYNCNFNSAVNFTLEKYYSTYSCRFTSSFSSLYNFEQPKKPYLAVSPSSIELETTAGDTARTKVITVYNLGTDTLDFQAAVATTNGGEWLTINKNSGNLLKQQSVNLFLKLNPGKLPDTTYKGKVTFTSVKGDNSPIVVDVKMTLTSNHLLLTFDPPDIKLGEWTTLNISYVDKYNRVIDSFDGGATVKLLPDTKEGLTDFSKTQSVLLTKGKAQPLFIFTPDRTKPFDTVITNSTVLSGPVVIEVKLENSYIKPDTAKIVIKAPIDFYIDKIEIQQGVANSDKEVTLEYKPGVQKTYPARSFVAGHNTVVRAFVKYNKTTDIKFNRIEYQLKGKLNITGSNISLGPFKMGWPGITDNPNAITLKDTFNLSSQLAMRDALFRYLDNSILTKPTTYSLQAELEYITDFDEKESEKENNKKIVDAVFQDSRQLKILAASGKLEGENYPAVSNSVWDFLKNVYPLNNSKFYASDFITNSYAFSASIFDFSINFWNTLTELFNRYNQMAQPQNKCDYMILFTTQKLGLKFYSDTIGGSASLNGKVCFVNANQSAGNVPAHELGHLLGLMDTYDPYKVYNPVMAFFATGDPNPRRTGADFTGNKIEDGNINWIRMRKSTSESVFYDFMSRASYDSCWIDRVTWDYLYKKFILNQAAKPLAGNYVAVSGILKQNDTLILNNVMKMDAVTSTDESLIGNYAVEFLSQSGGTLQKNNFNILFYSPEVYQVKEVPFNLYLPLPSGTSGLQVTKTDSMGIKKILASKIFSANAPVVKFISPTSKDTIKDNCIIKWSGSDADKDKLTYDLSYSPDGINEYIIAVGIKDTIYQWNVDKFPVSKAGYITIIASDGYNEGKDKSAPLIVTDINGENKQSVYPKAYSLEQCYPNPFNPSTTIKYSLPEECRVRLTVYNLLGETISVVEDNYKPAGDYNIVFNASSLASGVYFYSLQAVPVSGGKEFYKYMKMILLR